MSLLTMAERVFSLIGIGGCGNNLLNDFIVHSPKKVIETLQVYWPLNTNIQDLKALDITKNVDPQVLYSRNIIAPTLSKGRGAGMVWQGGFNYAKADLELIMQGKIDSVFWLKTLIEEKHAIDAKGVLLINGAGRGTGSGATPVIAKGLREIAKKMRREFYLLNAMVLPGMDAPPSSATNAMVSFALSAQVSDAIILISNDDIFDNYYGKFWIKMPQFLSRGEQRGFFKHYVNPKIVTFFIYLIIAIQYGAGILDIANIVRIARKNRPQKLTNRKLASIMVPAYYTSYSKKTPLDILSSNALKFAMVNFVPGTARAIYFIPVVPEDYPYTLRESRNKIKKQLRKILAPGKEENIIGLDDEEIRISAEIIGKDFEVHPTVLMLIIYPTIPYLGRLFITAKDGDESSQGLIYQSRQISPEIRDLKISITSTGFSDPISVIKSYIDAGIFGGI